MEGSGTLPRDKKEDGKGRRHVEGEGREL